MHIGEHYSWSELPPALQTAILAAVSVHVALLAIAMTIWVRHPASSGYSSNARYGWLAAIWLAQTIGPIVFLLARPWRQSEPFRGDPGLPTSGAFPAAGAERPHSHPGAKASYQGTTPAQPAAPQPGASQTPRPGASQSSSVDDVINYLYGKEQQ